MTLNKTQTKKLRKLLRERDPEMRFTKLAIYRSSVGWWVGREDWDDMQTAYPNYHSTADKAIEAALGGQVSERIYPWTNVNMK